MVIEDNEALREAMPTAPGQRKPSGVYCLEMETGIIRESRYLATSLRERRMQRSVLRERGKRAFPAPDTK